MLDNINDRVTELAVHSTQETRLNRKMNAGIF